MEAEKLRLQAAMTRHEGHDKAIENAQKQIEKAENHPQHGHPGDEKTPGHPGHDRGQGPDDHASPHAHKKNKDKDKGKAPHGHPNGKDKDKHPNHKGGQDGNGGPKHAPGGNKGSAKGQQ